MLHKRLSVWLGLAFLAVFADATEGRERVSWLPVARDEQKVIRLLGCTYENSMLVRCDELGASSPDWHVEMNSRDAEVAVAFDCYDWSTDNYVMIPAAVYGGTGDTFMMALEVPGIYVCRNRGEMLVFDHVEVKTLAHKGGGMVLQITTPTSFDATVTVLAEDEEQNRKPLGDNAFTEWKDKVKVKAGRMVTYKVK